MLRAVCFDLMGTVLYDPYPQAVEAATGMELATVMAHKDPQSWPDFEVGAIDEATFAERFFARPESSAPDGLRFDLAAFRRVLREGYCFLPGMAELVASLAGITDRYLASNYPVWVEELRQAFALDRRVEGVYASHHLGVRKPELSFYQRLLDRIGHAAGDCLFVDDRRHNCDGAREAGMRAHLFTSAADLADRLAAEGLPVDEGLRGKR
jgi:HAD superfamily hydrolase (TIGR01509 family)